MLPIADTGFLVAFWSRADAHHIWARGLSLRVPLQTCGAVLTEAAYLLGRPDPLLRMLVDGVPKINFNATHHASELIRWLGKYDDLSPGFADACVVRMAELTPKAEFLTTDRRDFTTHRTLAGQIVRCRFPD